MNGWSKEQLDKEITYDEFLKELEWYHGPTADDPDPGKMWCRACGGEVWILDGDYICRVCNRTSSN